jgi:hypothetical protein
MYMPLLLKILHLFKVTYPEDYMLIRWKLILFLSFYEIFLVMRTLEYGYRQWFQFHSSYRWTEVSYYFLEMMLIAMITYIVHRNLQAENEEDGSGNLKSSFFSTRDKEGSKKLSRSVSHHDSARVPSFGFENIIDKRETINFSHYKNTTIRSKNDHSKDYRGSIPISSRRSGRSESMRIDIKDDSIIK